jgi:hypothetical protein
MQQLPQDKQKAQRQGKGKADALDDVLALEVAQFVGQYGFNFFRASCLSRVSKNTMRLALPKPVK